VRSCPDLGQLTEEWQERLHSTAKSLPDICKDRINHIRADEIASRGKAVEQRSCQWYQATKFRHANDRRSANGRQATCPRFRSSGSIVNDQ
jgi:hypothetical protein